MGCCIGRDRGSVTSDDADENLSVGKNRALIFERVKWKSDVPLTEGQLRSKRDEFWDTAPAFDGRKEIWDALRAAVSHAEQDDLVLAQAIIDGANISLPDGTLRECYDELGNRYQIPLYCLCPPINLIDEQSEESLSCVNLSDSAATCLFSGSRGSDWIPLKFRISRPNDKSAPDGSTDLKLYCLRHETVFEAKNRLHAFSQRQAQRKSSGACDCSKIASNTRRTSESDARNNLLKSDLNDLKSSSDPVVENTENTRSSFADDSHEKLAEPTVAAVEIDQLASISLRTAECDAVLLPLLEQNSLKSATEVRDSVSVPRGSSHVTKACSTADGGVNVTSSMTVVPSADRQRWLFGGNLLPDRNRLDDCRLSANFVINVLTSDRPFTVDKHRSFGLSASIVGARASANRCRRSRRSKCHPAQESTPLALLAGPSSSNPAQITCNDAPPTVYSDSLLNDERARLAEPTPSKQGAKAGGKRRSNKEVSCGSDGQKRGGVKSRPNNHR